MSSSPGPVHVTRGASLTASGGQTSGMIRKNAITSLSSKICASVMIAKPHTSSDVHHHGEQDTIVQDLGPGDFALIPAYKEHQEVNDSDEEVVWIITRSGGEPIVENLKGWNQS
ncbi:hypothetical protein H2203_003419 [Taxawa tesnikishii (nom. ined.)]|nr:hypothetical protein H2203_003419 [Dothideales sp. JES 119]